MYSPFEGDVKLQTLSPPSRKGGRSLVTLQEQEPKYHQLQGKSSSNYQFSGDL